MFGSCYPAFVWPTRWSVTERFVIVLYFNWFVIVVYFKWFVIVVCFKMAPQRDSRLKVFALCSGQKVSEVANIAKVSYTTVTRLSAHGRLRMCQQTCSHNLQQSKIHVQPRHDLQQSKDWCGLWPLAGWHSRYCFACGMPFEEQFAGCRSKNRLRDAIPSLFFMCIYILIINENSKHNQIKVTKICIFFFRFCF